MFFIILLAGVLITFGGLFVWSYHQDQNPANKAFKHGSFPKPEPSGVYDGSFSRKTSWRGKDFVPSTQKGSNIFYDQKEGNSNKYDFSTSKGQSLSGNFDVLKITYDQPNDPWWLHFIADEVTQTKEEQLQGKVYIKLGPLHFTLTYFELNKSHQNPPINPGLVN